MDKTTHINRKLRSFIREVRNRPKLPKRDIRRLAYHAWIIGYIDRVDYVEPISMWKFLRQLVRNEKLMFDKEGYPTEEALEVFSQWRVPDGDIHASAKTVFEYVKSLWQYEEYVDILYPCPRMEKPVVVVELHTLGWSGNEDIVEELRKTWFWYLYWQKSERGGHYRFEIPLEIWNR